MMMTKISKSDFISCLKNSQIMDSKALVAWLKKAPDESVKQMASRLVRDDITTQWQAKYLMAGRSRLDIGSHRLLEQILRDELGDRFLAVHNSLMRKVIIHVLPRELTKDESRLTEFIEKAKLAAKLDHPNLIHVYDIDQEKGRYCLVTEHVEGSTLESTSRQSLTSYDVARIASSVLAGLVYAHEHQVIHGSLSQSDLILTKDNRVKINNLTLSPLRQQLADIKKAPKAEEDFAAIAKIGSTLLAEVSAPDQPDETLVKIFSGIDAENPLTLTAASKALTDWLSENAPPETAPGLRTESASTGAGAFDQPIATTSVQRKPKEPDDDPVPEEEFAETRGYLARLWKDNPIAVIATASVLALLILGGSTFGALTWIKGGNAEANVALSSNNEPTTSPDWTKKPAPDFDDAEAMESMIAKIGDDNNSTAAGENSERHNKRDPGKTESSDPPVSTKEIVEDTTDASAPTADDPTVTVKPEAPQVVTTAKTENETEATSDDLTEIGGIGEKTSAALVANGITTFKKLASSTSAELTQILKKSNLRVAKKNPDRWIVAAKELANDASPISTAVTESLPPEVAPTPTPSAGPFDKFPKVVQLPPCDNTAEVKLANLVIRKQYLLGADLIAEPGISKTKVIFELKRTIEDKQKWLVGVKRRENEDAREIAAFRKSEDALYFQWLPAASTDKTASKHAPYLRNCFLKLIVPENQLAFLTLRKPLKIRDLRLTESLSNELEFSIEAMPRRDTIVVEVLPLRVPGTRTTVVNPQVENGQPTKIWLSQSDKTGFLWIQVTGELRSKLQLQSGLALLTQGQTVQVKNPESLDQLLATLEAAAAQSATRLEQATKPPNLNWEEYKKIKASLEADAKATLSQKNKMAGYLTTLSKVVNHPIKVRVYAKLGNYQIVLAVTDPGLHQEPAK